MPPKTNTTIPRSINNEEIDSSFILNLDIMSPDSKDHKLFKQESFPKKIDQ